MPDVSVKDSFSNYHLNHYFLDLNDAFLFGSNPQNPSVYKPILDFIRYKVEEKNKIDEELLDRKVQHAINKQRLIKLDELQQGMIISGATHPSKISDSQAFTNYLKNRISDVNSHRLDMVWSRALIEVCLSYFGFFVPELKQLIGVVSLANGLASYGFYVLRGGVDAMCAFKNVLPHKKFDEHQIKFIDRLAFQTEQRYQRIINDLLLWAPVNYITFHYWTGPGWLGFAGNFLTLVLLLGDYSLNRYIYYDKIRQFNLIVADIEQKIPNSSERQLYLNELTKAHIEVLKNIDFEMKYQLSLVTSFFLLWSPFYTSGMIFVLLGAVGCFLLQLTINQRNLVLNYANETNLNKKNMMIYEGLNRLILQLAIPTVYLVTGLAMMPMFPMISAPIMFALATAINGMIVRFNHDLMAIFKGDNQGYISLQENLMEIGSGVLMTSGIALGLVRYSLLSLNASFAIAIGMGLLTYTAFDYLMSVDQKLGPVI